MSTSEVQTAVLSLRPDVVVTVLENEAVLLDLETKYFYSVNATGWAIVQLLENGTTTEQVRGRCQEWGALPEDAAAITRFLDALLGDRLAVACPQMSAADGVVLGGTWTVPVIEKHQQPLQRIMISAFDPTLPLAE